MEATLVGDGILLRPKEVVDRNASANRIASILTRTEPSPDDAGRSENEILEEILADIAEARRARRARTDRRPPPTPPASGRGEDKV